MNETRINGYTEEKTSLNFILQDNEKKIHYTENEEGFSCAWIVDLYSK